ncbi:MAG: Cobalt uptake protein cot1 [Phylliscum demangeonii]|nr:MAG: Cobalt uptake protein cot1 [Phylliscum demangeonii]
MPKKDQLAHVRAERDILPLAESDSAWVVKLFGTFDDAIFLNMLMEFVSGGDRMTMPIAISIHRYVRPPRATVTRAVAGR